MAIVQIRRGTTQQWAQSLKVLRVGELGLDTTLSKLKAGNGVSLWADLPFISKGDTGAASTIPGPKGDTGNTGPAGAASTVPGPKGDTGDTGPAGEGFNFRGEWITNTLYLQNDIVTQNGSTYIANYDYQDTMGPYLDGDLWAPIALKGTNGTDGADALWNYIGEYDGGTAYAVGDIVTYDGQLWYRYNSNGGNVGDTPSPGLWNLLAAKGSDGSDGTNGAGFGIYYLGNYVSTNGYLPDVAVVRGSDGQLYLAKASGQLGDPINYQSNGQWEVWIPKGEKGDTGDTGPAAEIQDSGWIAVTSLDNSFTSPTAVAYRKINNIVYMRGNLFQGTSNTTAFTLPAGYRPSIDVVVPVQKFGTGVIDYITVYADGRVTPNSTAAWLSSVVFPVG